MVGNLFVDFTGIFLLFCNGWASKKVKGNQEFEKPKEAIPRQKKHASVVGGFDSL